MQPALSITAFVIVVFLPIADVRADCSALASPSRDPCLRLELRLAEEAAQCASETLLDRLEAPTRAALKAEELWRKKEQRSCLGLKRLRRAYTPDYGLFS
jgi:hypothetical protein